MTAKGSWNSPIYISDDEDENDVAGQLICPESAPAPPATSTNQLLTSANLYPIYSSTSTSTPRTISPPPPLPHRRLSSPGHSYPSSSSPPPPAAATAAKVTAPKKPVSLIIGMNPDKDRHSKHGTFHPSPHAITSPAVQSRRLRVHPQPGAHARDGAAAQTHRTREFIKSWSKGARVEFATAELARKAWGSPKLGGVSGPPVKGKPRADGGCGRAGVGELEPEWCFSESLHSCLATRAPLVRDLARRLRMEMALGQALQPRMKTSRTHRAYRLRHDLRPVRCVLERHCRCSSPPRTPTPPPFSSASAGRSQIRRGRYIRTGPCAQATPNRARDAQTPTRLDWRPGACSASPRHTHGGCARASSRIARAKLPMSGACAAVARIPQVAAPTTARTHCALDRLDMHTRPSPPTRASSPRAPRVPHPCDPSRSGGRISGARTNSASPSANGSRLRRYNAESESRRRVHAVHRAHSPYTHVHGAPNPRTPPRRASVLAVRCALAARHRVRNLVASVRNLAARPRRAVLPASADSVLRTTYHP
ncbi:hypothetical protein DFH06DRAFT_1376031 [Mycena polygramma]|nr:hypothetical protein DFH06DRAFT_1376031 [Mycena polygramma]